MIHRLLPRRRPHGGASRRGQSLVEFAITLPVMLLIVLGTIDLGRAYFQTINMENAVKEGAFFGARNPDCPTNSTVGCIAPRTVEGRVDRELDGVVLSHFDAKCFAPGTTDFSGSGKPVDECADGDLYYVEVESEFGLITPLMTNLLGDSLTLRSTATSVVLTNFANVGAVDVGGGGSSASPTPTLAASMCMVPNFGNGTKLSQVTSVWQDAAGFTTTPTVVGPNGQDASWQSLPAGHVGACASTTIVVSNSPQATATPTPTPTPTPVATPTPTPVSSASPTATPVATPTATPAPTPQSCTVPQMVTSPRKTVTQAQALWTAAGFRAENFTASRPPNSDYQVKNQSIAANQVRPCLTTTITVSN
jgi:hypothetical protein